MKNFKQSIVLFGVVITLWGCSNQSELPTEQTEKSVVESNIVKSNFVNIKYRDTAVDIAAFETFDTSKSSLVRGAWYDSDNKYMVVKLNNTYYQYCEFPKSSWSSFKKASSFGTYFNKNIKGNYDCKDGYVSNL